MGGDREYVIGSVNVELTTRSSRVGVELAYEQAWALLKQNRKLRLSSWLSNSNSTCPPSPGPLRSFHLPGHNSIQVLPNTHSWSGTWKNGLRGGVSPPKPP